VELSPKNTVVSFELFPRLTLFQRDCQLTEVSHSSNQSTSASEIYDFVLSLYRVMEHVDLAVVMDNQALYRICAE
jgi:hypothetical protein